MATATQASNRSTINDGGDVEASFSKPQPAEAGHFQQANLFKRNLKSPQHRGHHLHGHS